MEEKICPLTKEVKPSSVEGPACDSCALLLDMNRLVNQAAQMVKEHPLNRQFALMKEEYFKLRKLHKKCAGCGLCFGGEHIAFPKTIPGIGELCQWCAQDIKKQGIIEFKKRLKKEGGHTR